MIVASHGIIGSQIVQATGLLIEYPGAAAAYSLRQLTTAYTGSAIGVRRTDLEEMDIGFVENELDTSALTTFANGGNVFVKTWYDQSGNARNATQATAANQPQIVSSGSVILENGQPAIRFFNANFTFLENSNLFSYNTIFTVTRFITRPLRVGLARNVSTNTKVLSDVSGLSYRISSTTALNSGVLPSLINQQLIYGLFNTVNSEIAIDGNTAVVGNTGTADGTGIRLGIGIITDVQSGLNGTFQELIAYSSNQSTNRTGIEDNINDFYSIY